jgi:ubiquinone/menaquinone biosynthesis C-methylase UbiE
MKEDKNRVCPVELANSLDSKIRGWLQNPQKILSPYITKGMTALDIGCGPGFFSVEMAKLVGEKGRIIAADLQEGMLQKLRGKIKGTALENRIELVKCDKDNINVSDKVDFILAFYMIHEVPDKEKLFASLKKVLMENGQFLIVEPKLFHVTKKEFKATIHIAEMAGFKTADGPKLHFSLSALLTHN